ncbi:MAG TPA: hypothetical protein VFS00_27495 [Polyangiaceae bacterium]|nr:hypothetical protein [Polyangiaceae bacterium]
MREALSLTLSLLICSAGVLVACSSDDDPEPGFTQTGDGGSSGAAGGSGGSGGAGGQGGAAGALGAGQSGSGGGSQGGGGGSGGAGGQGGGGGQGGFCGDDPNEPNDNEVQARRLPGTDNDGIMSDCDAEDSVNGLLEGAEDEDWFFFEGQDDTCVEFGDNIQPHARVESGSPVEVCIFVKPADPDESDPATCAENGGTPSDELAGYAGCCGDEEARALFGSTGGDDRSDVRIRVSKLSGALCGAYRITFAYGN